MSETKAYVFGDHFSRGHLLYYVVPGGYAVSSNPGALCFVPDPRILVFDTAEEKEAWEKEQQEHKEFQERYHAPLSEGAKAWIDEAVERKPSLGRYSIEHVARSYIAEGKPLIYSFGDSLKNSDEGQPLERKRTWIQQLLGL